MLFRPTLLRKTIVNFISLFYFQLPLYPSSAHTIGSLPNGPVANGTDMQVQGSLGAQHDATSSRPLDGAEGEVNARLVCLCVCVCVCVDVWV